MILKAPSSSLWFSSPSVCSFGAGGMSRYCRQLDKFQKCKPFFLPKMNCLQIKTVKVQVLTLYVC